MSNQLPSNVFAGGAVGFNSAPYTNYYLQQKARNEAKKEAIDNYYAEMSKSLTPTGMAENDVDDFIAGKNQWQQFNIQNKNILNDPKHPDYAKVLSQSNYLYNNVASLIPKSQDKVKKSLEYYKLTSGNKRGVTQSSIDEIERFNAPVLKGGGVDFNPTKIVANPDLFDAQKQKSFLDVTFEGIKPEKILGETVTDAKTKEKRTPYTEAYNPKSLEIASKRALSLYENTPEAQAYFENELDKHGQDFENNNAAFKAAYGRDITNGKDLAIGWVLNNGSTVNSGIDVHPYTPPSTTNIRVNGGGVINAAGGGNELYGIGTSRPLVFGDYIISGGQAVNKNGQPVSATFNDIPASEIPASLYKIVKPFLKPDEEDAETYSVQYKDGLPIAIAANLEKREGNKQAVRGSWVSIDAINNAQNQAYNPNVKQGEQTVLPKIKTKQPVSNPVISKKPKKVNFGNN